MLDPYIASGPYVDGGSFRLELQDLSLGGVALRTTDARFGALETGTVLRDITLQLGSFSTLRLDLEIVAPRHLTTPKGDRRFVIGCEFVQTSGPAERTLQRVVTQLETKRQALVPAGKVAHRDSHGIGGVCCRCRDNCCSPPSLEIFSTPFKISSRKTR